MRTFASALPVTIIVFALAIFHSAGALADSASPNAPNPAAIARVKSGEIVEANAAWWGFNAEDSTECLQAAIDSGAKKLVIPFMDREWIARPLKLRSNIEIVFEPGVIVLAKKGEFTAGGDSLFSATDAADITLYGKGATLRMRKRDYQKPPYSKAEWRSTLDFTG